MMKLRADRMSIHARSEAGSPDITVDVTLWAGDTGIAIMINEENVKRYLHDMGEAIDGGSDEELLDYKGEVKV